MYLRHTIILLFVLLKKPLLQACRQALASGPGICSCLLEQHSTERKALEKELGRRASSCCYHRQTSEIMQVLV